MSRQIGIDIRENIVRVAALRSSYRKVVLEGLNEVERAKFETLGDAVRAAAQPFLHAQEGIGVALEGSSAFVHRLPLPPAALKQVEEVLPFELEAQLPVDFEELVYDSRVLPRERGEHNVEVLAVAAPIKKVKALIELTREALDHEAERVGAGALPLGNLAQVCPELQSGECIAILDVAEKTTDILIQLKGTNVYARSLNIGVAGLPDNAVEFTSKLRQTLAFWLTTSEHAVERVYLAGAGPASPGMVEYFTAHLGTEVAVLPRLNMEIAEESQPLTAAYAKAIALALGLKAGARDLNLRQGELAYSRGYGFLKEKVPMIVGLVAVALVSFVFSAWAESRSLSRENRVLEDALATLTHNILQQETTDVDEILDILDGAAVKEQDPQPEMDAFDVALALAARIPTDIEHDVTELEFRREHVTIKAVVPNAEDAQKIPEALKNEKCFKDIKISDLTRVVKSDHQKYTMDFDVRCKDVKAKKKAKVDKEEGE
jgi:general secretion pathway protein L